MSNDQQPSSSVNAGNVDGGIHGSALAGRDINFIIQIAQQTGGPQPQAFNLAGQLAALQQALPHMTQAAQIAQAQALIRQLEQLLAELPQHEQAYLERVRAKFAPDADSYIELQARTTERETASPPRSRSARRRQRAVADYCEWIPAGPDIARVELNSLREGVDKYPCIILLGEPGSGKTTALEHLAYEFAGEKLQAAETERLIPLPLRLSEFGPGLTPEAFIVQGWGGATETGHWGATAPAANLEGYLEQGRLFILFDALNEMPRAGFKERAAALRQFIDRWAGRGNRFLVTCRVLDYGQELTGLQRVEVLPLTENQIAAFLDAEMVHEDATCIDLWQQLKQAENEAERDKLYEKLGQELAERGLLAKWQGLWDTLRRHGSEQRRLLELARNPYLLTMIIDVFLEDGHLGANRADLMARFAHLLLEWAKRKCRPELWLDADIQHQALAVMAFETQRRSGFGTRIPTELVKAVMPAEVQLDPNWPPVAAPADQVLELAASASLIEMPVDRGSVRFYHQLLQEYFAASELLRRVNIGDWSGFGQLTGLDATALWRWPWLESEMPAWERPEESWEPLPLPPPTNWEETTILAAGLLAENADPLLQRLIPVNPVLAGRCLVEGEARVNQTTGRELIEALLAAIEQPEVALRVRIAAGEVLGYLGDPRIGELVTIPAGEFVMGSERRQIEQAGIEWEAWMERELPRHTLHLAEYRIGRYPVTNLEYSYFVEAGGYQDQRWWTAAGWEAKENPAVREEFVKRFYAENEWELTPDALEYWVGQGSWQTPREWANSRFNWPNQPVVGVSWFEAVAYCRWLEAQIGAYVMGKLEAAAVPLVPDQLAEVADLVANQGWRVRLPTEAEWEKAARGTDGRVFPWGNEFDPAQLNMRLGEQMVSNLTPVGIYPGGRSPYGLDDCAGNVWEWCATAYTGEYKKYPYELEDEWCEDYLNRTNVSVRVLRGGSWGANDEDYARCAYRFRVLSNNRNTDWGFRVVVSPIF